MTQLPSVALTPHARPALTDDLYGRFIAYLDASETTVQTYTRALRQLAAYLEARGIAQPAREDILAYRDALRIAHKPATVQSYMAAARLFFAWLEREGLYPNVADHIRGARISREHKKDYLTSAQTRAVLDGIDRTAPHGLRDWAMLALMVTGGLRTIEVARADAGDLRTLGDDCVLYIQGKGRDEKAEYVKVPPEAEQAIRAYWRARGSVKPGQPLFTSLANRNAGGRMTARSVSRIVKYRLLAAGFDSDRLTAHSLRHTAVTLSLLGGKTLQEAQQFARHSNIATTQVYAHNLDRARNDCEQVIAQAIFQGAATIPDV